MPSHPQESIDFIEPKIEKRPRIEANSKIEEPKNRSEMGNHDVKMIETEKYKDQHLGRE
jgi:hypothetical protein